MAGHPSKPAALPQTATGSGMRTLGTSRFLGEQGFRIHRRVSQNQFPAWSTVISIGCWISTVLPVILEVESGVTLGQIYRFATPRGLFLLVQPGHPKITVGGCIGADVHGKNQFRDGTFLNVVESLRLFHPSHGVLELSRSSNPDLFFLTCGGYGLTGNILTARLRLAPIPSSRIVLKTFPVRNIYEFADDLAQAAAPE